MKRTKSLYMNGVLGIWPGVFHKAEIRSGQGEMDILASEAFRISS